MFYPGEEADERVLVVPGEGVPHEGYGLAPHHVEEAPRVEAGQVAAVGLPPPVDEAEVRLAIFLAVLHVDHRAGVLGLVVRVQVRHPVPAEDVAALGSALAGGEPLGKCKWLVREGEVHVHCNRKHF
jgi:hypothetical protein